MEAPEERDDRPPGRFYDAERRDDPAIFQFERMAPPNYRVMRQFEYVDALGHWYRVPKDVANNSTDFASIPFLLPGSCRKTARTRRQQFCTMR